MQRLVLGIVHLELASDIGDFWFEVSRRTGR
jgi:hypothetical protein